MADEEVPAPLSVWAALSLVMADVQNVSKSGRNESQNFNFRGIDAVMNAVGPALRARGVIVLPSVKDVNYESYQTRNGAQMRNCTMTVAFTFVGPAGDLLVCSTVGEAADSGDKATSKAHSVAFRTALLQALCIPTDEPDPDASAHERATAPAPPAVITSAQYERIKKACDTKELRDEFRGRFGVPAAQLPADRWPDAEDWISDLEADGPPNNPALRDPEQGDPS